MGLVYHDKTTGEKTTTNREEAWAGTGKSTDRNHQHNNNTSPKKSYAATFANPGTT